MNSLDVTKTGHYIYSDSKRGKFYVSLEDYQELEKELNRLREQNNINDRETST